MAYRDMIKTAEKAKGIWRNEKYLTCYDLSVDEISQLLKLSEQDIVKAICTAFDYGFVLGIRAHSKHRTPEL